MKIAYKPFSIVAALVGARIGREAFESTWSKLSSSPKPRPGAPENRLDQAIAAAALEAAMIATAATVAHHLAARAFHHLFGVWPEHAPGDGGGGTVSCHR